MDPEGLGTPIDGASVALFRGPSDAREVLLVLRGRGARAGQWSLPGGHVEPGEAPRAAALRELREETGLDPAAVALGGTPARVVHVARYRIFVFVGRLVAGDDAPAPRLRTGDDAADAAFARVGALVGVSEDTARIVRALARDVGAPDGALP